MKLRYLSILCFMVFMGMTQVSTAQSSPDHQGGLKIKFNEDGSKYLKFTMWAQMQVNTNFDPARNIAPVSLKLRRARVNMQSQINKKTFIFLHFGTNNLTASALSPSGTGAKAQMFIHDATIEYNYLPTHTIGLGLHAYGGISRLNSQGTLNLLTLDNNLASWATGGLSDQFSRHLGVYAKGKFNKLRYQVAVNDVSANSSDTRTPTDNLTVYGGKNLLGSAKAGFAYAGYFSYNFLDQEGTLLPFRVGTYLGKKKVFNIGTGFFVHPNGSVRTKAGELIGENVNLFAVDAFYDTPLADNGSALTAYVVAQFNDYGTDYLLGKFGSGTMIYSHVGYLLPNQMDKKVQFQPYLSLMNNRFEIGQTATRFGVGMNAYLDGNNAKLTLEYTYTKQENNENQGLSLQAMIYL